MKGTKEYNNEVMRRWRARYPEKWREIADRSAIKNRPRELQRKSEKYDREAGNKRSADRNNVNLIRKILLSGEPYALSAKIEGTWQDVKPCGQMYQVGRRSPWQMDVRHGDLVLFGLEVKKMKIVRL